MYNEKGSILEFLILFSKYVMGNHIPEEVFLDFSKCKWRNLAL